MEAKTVSWQQELANLSATARTADEQAAVQAFAKAIGPYLEKPDLLRTLLGKIQSPIPSGALGLIVAERQFASLDAVKAKLPDSVNVVTL